MKKSFINLFLVLGITVSLCSSYLYVFADEIETNVTVRILRDDTTQSEISKEQNSNKESEKQKISEETVQSRFNKKFPKTNELITPLISIIGILLILLCLSGIYINKKRNGENNNKKN
ncbi:LPXTG cell wall anchor domain-containing protein [Candidatus Enterococcus ikei]|uniref:LPXTG cell wall anchor domain-containing protein n=1 Tax=Candidatus Enterococcus ikei TaxID=2815326 RepID=A0ABS3H180_9ENTE|nr:LPXTG cell wall anchor domain-containing protein [Enterococcus sp. DIV0869a]MBO0441287.1 LPXTG cell wall anchor domain-containing protein [Enterococcus sp. DIV0869a]